MLSNEEPTFLIDYAMDGKTFSFDLMAKDFDDAARRIHMIKNNAQIRGQLMSRTKVNSVTLPFTALWYHIKARWWNF